MRDLASRMPLSAMPTERPDMAAWIQVLELFRRHGMPEPPVRLRDEIVHFMMWGWYGEQAAKEIDRLQLEVTGLSLSLEQDAPSP